jgi:hypothetical protein
MPEAPKTGLRFRETLKGRVALRTSDPVAGFGAVSAFAALMHAEILVDDVAAFITGNEHVARLRAELLIPVLGGRFRSEEGTFALFQRGVGPDGRPVQQMIYTATFVSDERVYEMTARKILQPSLHPWSDTTTARVVMNDRTGDADVVRPRHAAGFVKISPWSFLVQLTTMRGCGDGTTRKDRNRAVLTYAKFFVAGLAKTYLQRARW